MGYYDDPDSEQRAQDWDDTLNTVDDTFDDYSEGMADDVDDSSKDLVNDYKKHNIKGMKDDLEDIDDAESSANEDMSSELETESEDVDLDDTNEDENGPLMKATPFDDMEDDIKDDLDNLNDDDSKKDLKNNMAVLEKAHKDYQKTHDVGLFVGDAGEEGDSYDADAFYHKAFKEQAKKELKATKAHTKSMASKTPSHANSKFNQFQKSQNSNVPKKHVKSMGQKQNPKLAQLRARKQGQHRE